VVFIGWAIQSWQRLEQPEGPPINGTIPVVVPTVAVVDPESGEDLEPEEGGLAIRI
jgi:hypothetical protein